MDFKNPAESLLRLSLRLFPGGRPLYRPSPRRFVAPVVEEAKQGVQIAFSGLSSI